MSKNIAIQLAKHAIDRYEDTVLLNEGIKRSICIDLCSACEILIKFDSMGLTSSDVIHHGAYPEWLETHHNIGLASRMSHLYSVRNDSIYRSEAITDEDLEDSYEYCKGIFQTLISHTF